MNYLAKVNDYRLKINGDMDYVNGQIRRLKVQRLSASGAQKNRIEKELREMNMQVKLLRELKRTLENTNRSISSQTITQR